MNPLAPYIFCTRHQRHSRPPKSLLIQDKLNAVQVLALDPAITAELPLNLMASLGHRCRSCKPYAEKGKGYSYSKHEHLRFAMCDLLKHEHQPFLIPGTMGCGAAACVRRTL